MDQPLKARWVAALRSGEYQQCVGALQKGGAFCCLGVLCDLIAPERWSAPRGDIVPFAYQASSGQFAAESMPPADILVRAGVTFEGATKLAHANDQGESFAQIASRIETDL